MQVILQSTTLYVNLSQSSAWDYHIQWFIQYVQEIYTLQYMYKRTEQINVMHSAFYMDVYIIDDYKVFLCY